MHLELLSLVSLLCVSALISTNCLLEQRQVRAGPRVAKLSKALSAHKFQLPSSLRQQLLDTRRQLHQSRSKRDSDNKCGLKDDVALEAEPQELSEKAEAIQAVWVGKDEILIVASDKTEHGSTTVWNGMLRKSIGIFNFKANLKAIDVIVAPDSLQVSPAGNRATVIVAALSGKYIFVSRDFGQNWDKYATPTSNFDSTEELYMSNRDPRHLVIRSRSSKLYVSDNWGERWIFISGNVKLVEFAQVSESTEYIYYSTSSVSASFNPLYRYDINTMSDPIVIDRSAYRFRVDNRYLFVSRKNSTGNQEADEHSRRLYVASNYESNKVQFTEVQLPTLTDQQFYVVMATHESGVFIHVYDGTDQSSGNLYVSDSSGSRFSLSLSNHLFQVHNYPLGHYSVHDFYEVLSMRGVYITTMVKGSGHMTMITFDNGGIWRKLSPPPGSCDGCSLHLHLRFSRMVSPMFNTSSATDPLSVKTAPGIILAHGTVGMLRNDNGNSTKVYISNDGGYSWIDPGLPVGTYVYGIADYGNIIAVAPDSDTVENIWFSHNHGACFVKRNLDTTGVFHLSRGLLFDPSAASLFGFVMGVEGTGQDDEWRVITLNFGSLLRRECGPKDYEAVTEHIGADNCLMGYKRVYNITRKDRVCYNEAKYNYAAIRQDKCDCSYSDYECDYGFNRTAVTTCSKQSGFSLAQVCPPGQQFYMESTSGFRMIPGDLCTPTADSKKIVSKVMQSCTGHEEDSGFRVHKGSTGTKIAVMFLIVVVSIIAAGLLLFGWLKCKREKALARDRVFYQRLPLKEGGQFSANDSSSSDEDLITAT